MSKSQFPNKRESEHEQTNEPPAIPTQSFPNLRKNQSFNKIKKGRSSILAGIKVIDRESVKATIRKGTMKTEKPPKKKYVETLLSACNSSSKAIEQTIDLLASKIKSKNVLTSTKAGMILYILLTENNVIFDDAAEKFTKPNQNLLSIMNSSTNDNENMTETRKKLFAYIDYKLGLHKKLSVNPIHMSKMKLSELSIIPSVSPVHIFLGTVELFITLLNCTVEPTRIVDSINYQIFALFYTEVINLYSSIVLITTFIMEQAKQFTTNLLDGFLKQFYIFCDNHDKLTLIVNLAEEFSFANSNFKPKKPSNTVLASIEKRISLLKQRRSTNNDIKQKSMILTNTISNSKFLEKEKPVLCTYPNFYNKELPDEPVEEFLYQNSSKFQINNEINSNFYKYTQFNVGKSCYDDTEKNEDQHLCNPSEETSIIDTEDLSNSEIVNKNSININEIYLEDEVYFKKKTNKNFAESNKSKTIDCDENYEDIYHKASIERENSKPENASSKLKTKQYSLLESRIKRCTIKAIINEEKISIINNEADRINKILPIQQKRRNENQVLHQQRNYCTSYSEYTDLNHDKNFFVDRSKSSTQYGSPVFSCPENLNNLNNSNPHNSSNRESESSFQNNNFNLQYTRNYNSIQNDQNWINSFDKNSQKGVNYTVEATVDGNLHDEMQNKIKFEEESEK